MKAHDQNPAKLTFLGSYDRFVDKDFDVSIFTDAAFATEGFGSAAFHHFTQGKRSTLSPDDLIKSAVAAYLKDIITKEQMITATILAELKKEFGEVQVKYPTLDEKIFTTLPISHLFKDVDPRKHPNLLEQLKALPLSEQRYFSVIMKESVKNERLQYLINKLTNTLSLAYKSSDTEPSEMSFYTFSMMQLATQFLYPDNHRELTCDLGLTTQADMYKKMLAKERPLDFPYPSEAIPHLAKFHGIEHTKSNLYTMFHDLFHLRLLVSVGNDAYHAWFEGIRFILNKLPRDSKHIDENGDFIAKEIWYAVDFEAGLFLNETSKMDASSSPGFFQKPADYPDQFYRLLTEGRLYNEHVPYGLFDMTPLNDTAWMLLINMITHPDKYKSAINLHDVPEGSIMHGMIQAAYHTLHHRHDLAEQVARAKARYFNIILPAFSQPESFKIVIKNGHIQVEANESPLVAGKEAVMAFLTYMVSANKSLECDSHKAALRDINEVLKKMDPEGARKKIETLLLQSVEPQKPYSKNILTALSEGWLTKQDITNIIERRLAILTSNNGLIAMREKLLNVKQAAALTTICLKSLLSNNGLMALREHLLDPEDVPALGILRIHVLLSDNGLTALREHLINPTTAASLDTMTLAKFISTEIAKPPKPQ